MNTIVIRQGNRRGAEAAENAEERAWGRSIIDDSCVFRLVYSHSNLRDLCGLCASAVALKCGA